MLATLPRQTKCCLKLQMILDSERNLCFRQARSFRWVCFTKGKLYFGFNWRLSPNKITTSQMSKRRVGEALCRYGLTTSPVNSFHTIYFLILIHILHLPIFFTSPGPMVYHLLSQKKNTKTVPIVSQLPPEIQNQYLLHNVCAATTSYPSTLIRVRGLQTSEGDLGGLKLILGRLVGIKNEDIHIFLEGFKCEDHTLQGRGDYPHGPVRLVRIGTWRLHIDTFCICSTSHHLNAHVLPS